jgi:hypothetical protein
MDVCPEKTDDAILLAELVVGLWRKAKRMRKKLRFCNSLKTNGKQNDGHCTLLKTQDT